MSRWSAALPPIMATKKANVAGAVFLNLHRFRYNNQQ